MSRVLPRILAALVTVGAGLVAALAAHADSSPVQDGLRATNGEASAMNRSCAPNRAGTAL